MCSTGAWVSSECRFRALYIPVAFAALSAVFHQDEPAMASRIRSDPELMNETMTVARLLSSGLFMSFKRLGGSHSTIGAGFRVDIPVEMSRVKRKSFRAGRGFVNGFIVAVIICSVRREG